MRFIVNESMDQWWSPYAHHQQIVRPKTVLADYVLHETRCALFLSVLDYFWRGFCWGCEGQVIAREYLPRRLEFASSDCVPWKHLGRKDRAGKPTSNLSSNDPGKHSPIDGLLRTQLSPSLHFCLHVALFASCIDIECSHMNNQYFKILCFLSNSPFKIQGAQTGGETNHFQNPQR